MLRNDKNNAMNFLEASEKSSQFRVLKNFENFRISKNVDQKSKIPILKIFDFCSRFFFESEKFSKNIFFELEKKYFFSELRIFFGYSFDVKNYYLLIYDGFRAFWALFPCVINQLVVSTGCAGPCQ